MSKPKYERGSIVEQVEVDAVPVTLVNDLERFSSGSIHGGFELADGRKFILTAEDYARPIAVKTIDKYPTAKLVEEKA